jgi:hypothetical protein
MLRNKRTIVAGFCLVAGGMLCTPPAFSGAGPAFGGAGLAPSTTDISSAVEGESYVESMPKARVDLIEPNIVIALESGIPGMQADAAQLVRDLNRILPEESFSECVIPLMAILKNEQQERPVRILAALALDQIGSERGSFAIARTATFTSDPQVKYVCTWLAYERITGKHPEDKGMASFEPIEEGDE